MKGRKVWDGKRETSNIKVAAVGTGAWFLLEFLTKLQTSSQSGPPEEWKTGALIHWFPSPTGCDWLCSCLSRAGACGARESLGAERKVTTGDPWLLREVSMSLQGIVYRSCNKNLNGPRGWDMWPQRQVWWVEISNLVSEKFKYLDKNLAMW